MNAEKITLEFDEDSDFLLLYALRFSHLRSPGLSSYIGIWANREEAEWAMREMIEDAPRWKCPGIWDVIEIGISLDPESRTLFARMMENGVLPPTP